MTKEMQCAVVAGNQRDLIYPSIAVILEYDAGYESFVVNNNLFGV
jgi:hypothetical protein